MNSIPSSSSSAAPVPLETEPPSSVAPSSSARSMEATSSISRDDDDDEDEDDEDESNEDLDYYYYSFNEDLDGESPGVGGQLNNNEDPEFFVYDCLTPSEVQQWLAELVNSFCQRVQLPPSEAKLRLHRSQWSVAKASEPLATSESPVRPFAPAGPLAGEENYCEVCATQLQSTENFSQLKCRHRFCRGCWELHFETQISQGLSTTLSCMSINCDTLAPEEFVLGHLHKPILREKYLTAAFHDYIRCHPLLRFCPGLNCSIVIRCAKAQAKRVNCTTCKCSFCFKCGSHYHAPTDCETIKRWLTKCADDSETANYISAHTKDCPKCNICIEKNGGCNHMQCYNCKHDFCWMCLGDWKAHGSEYYECSRYKENPNIAHESAHAQAREALKKYLHYFERWENHSRSMKLEAQTLDKIKNRITDKVMSGSGTWIDWQYLLDASSLLARCRYTLQYTYPYAYYMGPSPRKELFEYQQAQLEAEIENLSWKIEHAETTDRGDLENQIDIAEKRRTSLLKDFLAS